MANRKTTRKPAAKRRSARKPASPPGRLGWIAAAVLAVGWAATDGRALSYVQANIPAGWTSAADATTAARRETRPEPRTASGEKPERTRMSSRHTPKDAPESPGRLAAVAPSPAPRLEPMRMPRDPGSRPAADDRMARDAIASVIRAEGPALAGRPAAEVPTAGSTTGGGRHATRRLDVRSAPADAGRVLAVIDSGTRVDVLHADGRWRYVKSTASRAEGWVDGTFLAGEAASAPPAPELPGEPSARNGLAAPVPPLAISASRR